MANELRPDLTLADIYGTEPVYSPRTSPNSCTWMPPGHDIRDMSTGGQLPVLGDMAILCASAVATPEALRLLRDAGLPVPERLHRYDDTPGYLRKLKLLAAKGRRLAIQHVHPAAEIAPDRYWVKRSLLAFLNNKANLPGFVGPAHSPKRRIVTLERLADQCPVAGFPLVVKAATDEPNGGGLDVAVCSSADDLVRVQAYFRTLSHVIVEDFIGMARNLCLGYAVAADGSISYLGSAEQVVDSRARYQGGWIDGKSEAPNLAVELGKQIVHRGAAIGYRGCAGIDTAILNDGGVIVFDLNFRICGSTAALLLARSIRENLGAGVMRLAAWRVKGSYDDMLRAAYNAMNREILLPLCSLDPGAGKYSDPTPRLSGLILGASRGEVKERERELAELGLTDSSLHFKKLPSNLSK